MFHAYGLFWQRDEINWNPGKGVRPHSPEGRRLLGRRNANSQKLRCADFWDQKGIYILHGHFGAYYVGLTFQGDMTLGRRLLQHCENDHWDNWDRFSWFGFRQVLKQRDEHGLQVLKGMPALSSLQVSSIITDTEALLHRALGPAGCSNWKNFAHAEEWLQVRRDEASTYLSRVAMR
jgi:hypothetical protein